MDLNRWNQIRYGWYAPVYDVAGRLFTQSRQASIQGLQLLPGQTVLLSGAGTGLDLEWIHPEVTAVAVDFTPAMIRRLHKRMAGLGLQGEVLEIDGHHLPFPDDSFDAVILHLVLAVFADPVKALQEAERVVKPGGRIAVFDVLVPLGKKINWVRKLAHIPVNFFFSVMTCRIESLVPHTGLQILEDVPADFWGQYRRILLQK
ncbi:MAG: methyltransferase domain-containing protein [Saprospiraceae bacterium]|nr:methyltransferase domain-containing protein [Saprospiraceae bacterium]